VVATRERRVAPKVTIGEGVDDEGRRTWTVLLPFTEALSLNKIIHAHRIVAWKRTGMWQDVTFRTVYALRIPALSYFSVTLHVAPRVTGQGVRDIGNCQAMQKPITDGIIKAWRKRYPGTTVDDNSQRYTERAVIYGGTGVATRIWFVITEMTEEAIRAS
jgi:hypothetical protein